MKNILKAASVALAVSVSASVAFADDAKPAAKTAALVTIAADELKWVPNPANPDVQMAVVWGDPAMGPHTTFHKFKAGFDAGVHSHSSDMGIAVISGTLIAGPAGGPEKKLPAGSYEFQPHGVKHTTKCDASGPCVIFVSASGKFDLTPADAAKK